MRSWERPVTAQPRRPDASPRTTEVHPDPAIRWRHRCQRRRTKTLIIVERNASGSDDIAASKLVVGGGITLWLRHRRSPAQNPDL